MKLFPIQDCPIAELDSNFGPLLHVKGVEVKSAVATPANPRPLEEKKNQHSPYISQKSKSVRTPFTMSFPDDKFLRTPCSIKSTI
jgi:hypothetical protein